MRNPMNKPNRKVMVKIMFEDLRPDEIVDVRENCKMPEFFEKSPLLGTGKHPDFQVTQT
jgi:hypothetical protein